ncbi:MAG: transporter substrate-binding domain-containing protein [Gammaproteobacteria bacterium]|nr:transporter substrate-binding domain-containing protein [Gammaproteobacteria bacterium]
MINSKTNFVSFYSVLNILLLTFSILPISPAFSQPTIVLNTAFASPISNSSQTGFADKVLTEAFHRIGYQLETVQLPAERALINANRGIDDGDLLRVAGLQSKYPNLIQVPEKIIDMDMVLFTKNQPSFYVDSWQSIKSHSIAIISGWKIMETNFGQLGDQIEIIKTDNIEQSLNLLMKDRVDFIAYSRWSGLAYLKEQGINGITLLSPPLVSPALYTYLHIKHKKIVPELAAAIRQMKYDGSIHAIYERILKPLEQTAAKKTEN